MFKGNVGGGLFEVYDHLRVGKSIEAFGAIDIVQMHF